MNIKILILEDNPKIISLLTKKLAALESKGIYLNTTVVTNTAETERINQTNQKFDVILLDEFISHEDSSFHILDFEKFGVEKIISISSVPSSNAQAITRGVRRTVLKDYLHLDEFADNVISQVEKLIGK